MEYILEFILEHLWESILGLVGAIVLVFFGYKKKSKSKSQKIFQFGLWNNAKNNITDKDTEED